MNGLHKEFPKNLCSVSHPWREGSVTLEILLSGSVGLSWRLLSEEHAIHCKCTKFSVYNLLKKCTFFLFYFSVFDACSSFLCIPLHLTFVKYVSMYASKCFYFFTKTQFWIVFHIVAIWNAVSEIQNHLSNYHTCQKQMEL